MFSIYGSENLEIKKKFSNVTISNNGEEKNIKQAVSILEKNIKCPALGGHEEADMWGGDSAL